MIEPADAECRKRIMTDVDATMLVEAGAGSGKTTSLVGRMLALIGSGKARVPQMVAVTFTRKAAAELKGRFQIALEEAARNEKPVEVRRRYREALLDLNLLFAGTIHSFCAHLLRERPVESGIDPEFVELEEEENLLLRSQCWTEYLEYLHASDNGLLTVLSNLGIDPASLAGIYENVCLYPDVRIAREELRRPDFSREKEVLDEYLRQAWEAIPPSVPDGDWDGLQGILLRCKRLYRALDLSKDKNIVALMEALNRSPAVTQNRWGDRETAKKQKQSHIEFRDDVIIPALERWHRYCHYYVMGVVLPGVRYFDDVRRKNSRMNFQDLLSRAAELLRNNSEVRAHFQKRFTHILVDEFQDTDPIQAEVVLYLTCEDRGARSWREVRVRPGSLFVVGDPKQSIYRFRRADIDTYNEVKEIVRRSGGSVVPLTVNFRSVPALCDWINPIFEGKFPAEADRFQAGFERLEPYSGPEGGGVRCITIEKQRGNNQAVVAARDAERIASWIAWALNGNFKVADGGNGGRTAGPEDFMILLRYRRHISLYARALEARGIPYEVAGGAGFRDSAEVGHLLTLLAAVSEPDDRVALVGTLRGPLYGVSDDLLYRFARGGGRFSYLLPDNECNDVEAQAVIGGILHELGEFYRWSRTMPSAAVLSAIVERLGMIPLAASMEVGETRTGNLLKVLELANSLSSRGNDSFAEIVRGLGQYYGEIETEEMSVEPGRKDVVRVMNLHKAKGLEAAAVFLADPLRNTDHEPALHIDRLADEAVGYFVATTKSGKRGETVLGIPPEWEAMENLEKQYAAAEEARLLYVAATRAKQLLVVSRYPSSPGKGAWKEFEPYLSEAEELEAPGIPSVRFAKPCVVTREQLQEASARREESLGKIRVPSYGYDSVTGIVEGEPGMSPFRNGGGMGKKWGSAVHMALEAMIDDEGIDLGVLSGAVLKREGLPLSHEPTLVRVLQRVCSSGLWKRVKAAEARSVEVPFAVVVRDAPTGIVSGKIDLAFKEGDGWVLVDFKSDGGEGNLENLVAYYSQQVRMYRECWEKITGQVVKETGIYFADSDRWIGV